MVPFLIAGSSAPAIPHIEAISADNKSIHLGEPVRIPASQKRITFDYTGLSLAVPERIRFRYFLEEFDSGWSQPVSTREAVYTNLGPGSYRFRLVACNSDSIWNGSETLHQLQSRAIALANMVVPVGVRTIRWASNSICVPVPIASVDAPTQCAVRGKTWGADANCAGVAYTLLQGVLSSSMQLNAANDQLSSDSPANHSSCVFSS